MARTGAFAPHASAYRSRRPAVVKSSAAIIRFLLTRSAKIPPKGENSTVGTMEIAEITPNKAAEPVKSSTAMDSANRRAALPNREIICPATIRVKSLPKSFFF